MTPVDMSIMHDPENGIFGDCQRACLASLLNLKITDVPHFAENGDNGFERRVNRYLGSQGLFPVNVCPFDFNQEHFAGSSDCYHLIYGYTDRGTYHAVVGLNGRIVHDPHPSRKGLLQGEEGKQVFVFLARNCTEKRRMNRK